MDAACLGWTCNCCTVREEHTKSRYPQVAPYSEQGVQGLWVVLQALPHERVALGLVRQRLLQPDLSLLLGIPCCQGIAGALSAAS